MQSSCIVDNVPVVVTPLDKETGLVRVKGAYIGSVRLHTETEYLTCQPIFSELCKVVKLWQIATGGN